MGSQEPSAGLPSNINITTLPLYWFHSPALSAAPYLASLSLSLPYFEALVLKLHSQPGLPALPFTDSSPFSGCSLAASLLSPFWMIGPHGYPNFNWLKVLWIQVVLIKWPSTVSSESQTVVYNVLRLSALLPLLTQRFFPFLLIGSVLSFLFSFCWAAAARYCCWCCLVMLDCHRPFCVVVLEGFAK